MAKEIILGIDLGTTNSVVSYMQADGSVKVIPNPEGHNTTPSVVAFKSNGEEIVGDAAKRQAITNPDTVMSIKRKMGTNEKVRVSCLNKDFTPQEISAKVLAYMKKYAEENLGQKVSKAVITVPAYFNDAQRQATKDAGQIAGLDVVRIINEPTAASLAYGLENKKEEKILVFDLGGGTFDVSILEIGDGTFEVIATSGDNRLGGDDWDKVVADWIHDQIRSQYGVDLNDKMAIQRFRDAAEKAKIELSAQLSTTISLPFIGMGKDGPISFETTLTRAKFQEMTKDLLRRTEEPVRRALADAKMSASDLDEVLLIGGSIRMPAVQELVKQLTGKSPNLSINPDEAVSIGASVQGGIVSGDVKDVVLLDVTPLTLGIETMGEVMTPLIQRNTTIPTTKSQIFSTAADNQPSVDIMVYQGERPMARDNKLLGHFRLDGIKPARRGQPRIEVTFSIDVNGIVKVTAKDLDTAKEQQITITGSSGLSKDEIDRMVKEAEANKDADEKRKEEVELKNKAESFINSIDEGLKEKGASMDAKQKEETEKLRDELKKALDANDMDTLRSKISELEKAAEMMAQMQADQGGKPEETATDSKDNSGSKGDDVVDADFTEDKKK
ncbi:MAG: molecular chaperone DnaK [Bacilli bacterium]|jgi:molecular chaperone DnaK|nr:molecular chaperone DnaK [Bacilli bacterium]MCH4201668.1 molecular chaperone DnaK [Bacilli bacterium]MCH4235250.1 molecular chaperone DnaK [Bacilli bacterium]